jgi:hypothetical protein
MIFFKSIKSFFLLVFIALNSQTFPSFWGCCDSDTTKNTAYNHKHDTAFPEPTALIPTEHRVSRALIASSVFTNNGSPAISSHPSASATLGTSSALAASVISILIQPAQSPKNSGATAAPLAHDLSRGNTAPLIEVLPISPVSAHESSQPRSDNSQSEPTPLRRENHFSSRQEFSDLPALRDSASLQRHVDPHGLGLSDDLPYLIESSLNSDDDSQLTDSFSNLENTQRRRRDADIGEPRALGNLLTNIPEALMARRSRSQSADGSASRTSSSTPRPAPGVPPSPTNLREKIQAEPEYEEQFTSRGRDPNYPGTQPLTHLPGAAVFSDTDSQ